MRRWPETGPVLLVIISSHLLALTVIILSLVIAAVAVTDKERKC